MNTKGVIAHITEWLADYIEKSSSNGFVVGVSGGIDSAVTSSLAARTGYPLLCLEMPIHQPSSHVSRARKHIERLESNFSNVRSTEVNLTPVYDAFVSSLPEPVDEGSRFLALANSRARIRMATLYYFAGLHGYLVSGTGNKVEDFGVGFFTKYGDGGVDLSPIADLSKSDVYTLAKEMDVVEEIQFAKPTDGLWQDDRSDEDQIGATYPELEWAMEYTPTNSEILTEREKTVLEIYQGFHRANQHKMEPIPVCSIPAELNAQRPVK